MTLHAPTVAETTRILAVDDDPGIRKLYERILAPPDRHPATEASLADLESRLFGPEAANAPREFVVDLTLASQGDEAVAAVREALAAGQPFGVVFLDIRMPPGPDGVWTAEQIRALDSRVEIVVVTAFSDVPPEEICRRAPPARQLVYLQKPFTPFEVRQLAGALCEKWLIREAEGKRTREEIVSRLAAAAETRDTDTGTHIHRIGLSAATLAWALGWSPEETDKIRVASLLHDVGKIGVPDSVLQKPGRLTDDEMAIMRTHTEVGARLLEGSDMPILGMARDIALYHHECWDGSGYPHGLAGAAIPESARIVALTDVFDALIHDRVYRPAFPEDTALAMMREGRGSQFDPTIFDCFVDVLPRLRAVREQVLAGSEPVSLPLQAAG